MALYSEASEVCGAMGRPPEGSMHMLKTICQRLRFLRTASGKTSEDVCGGCAPWTELVEKHCKASGRVKRMLELGRTSHLGMRRPLSCTAPRLAPGNT